MAEATPDEDSAKVFPSVDEVKPTEEGGPTARSGFSYQDEIAVGFLIDMLKDPTLLKVHCETQDDVVLVRAKGDSEVRLAEFVQVKALNLDKLWSVADLCKRPDNTGASIYEVSLLKDKCCEESRFRLVTLRAVVNDLKMLTLPLGLPGREIDGESFNRLRSELDNRYPDLKSPKSNTSSYWLEYCLWDVRESEAAIRKDNLLRLMRLSIAENRSLLLEHAEMLLDELRAQAKAAGDARWEPDRDEKIFTREALRKWWERRTHELIEGVTTPAGGKLGEKMTQAGLPDELVKLALEMRRDYAAAVRSPKYMDVKETERLRNRVKSEVLSLRSHFVDGSLVLDAAGFHSLCLDRMDDLNGDQLPEKEDCSAFLKGCMYDITDRCLLRFERPTR